MRLIALSLVLAASVQAQPLAEVVVHEDEWTRHEVESDEVFVGCSLACAVGWTLSASSALAPQGGNRYGAVQAGDNSARTAWVEGVPGDGEGEHVLFHLEEPPNGPPDHVIPFRGLGVVNGYGKTEAAWRANGRVREVLVRVNGEGVARAVLADTMFPQSIRFPEAVDLHLGDVISFEIVSVYPGLQYQDTAISEIVLYGAH